MLVSLDAKIYKTKANSNAICYIFCMNGDPFVLAIKYGKVVQMSHFTRKIPLFKSRFLRVLAERIVR